MRFHPFFRALFCSFLFACALVSPSRAQQPPKKSPEKSSAESEVPAQIELLETRVRFESNGDSRKEVHTLVHILNELGAQQFGRLTFDYNRAFQSVEIPQAHISHPEGGTSDILPSAISDHPNPATEGAPAYQDVRVKSVRILGLSPGDTLEYRVITTTTHHPLAPDFWFDHSFDHSGIVSQEILELDLPASHQVQIHINPAMPATSIEKSGEDDSARVLYRWSRTGPDHSEQMTPSENADVALTTCSWGELSDHLAKVLEPSTEATKAAREKALQLTASSRTSEARLQALYDFVSASIKTVDLPIDATGFRTRTPVEVLESGYATPEDKFVLLSGLASAFNIESRIALFGSGTKISQRLPTPSSFVNSAVLCHIPRPPQREGDGLNSTCDHCGKDYWVVPSMEVAPFAAIPATLRGQEAFVVNYMFDVRPFSVAPRELPFSSTQHVNVTASLGEDGKLAVKVHYSLRGDNELLLRVAFHQTPKEKWKELAQLLSISDGFRGQVSSVNASDPTATREPFSVDYEITEPKFLDWSKKPLHVPALLPQLGLPDPPGKAAAGATPPPIELGTPLEAEIRMTLHLPPGSAISAPTGTSVQRDYATFTSRYSAEGQTATAVRHIRFIARQLPADRAFDLNAFLRAVQTDEGQTFTLDRQSPATPAPLPKP